MYTPIVQIYLKVKGFKVPVKTFFNGVPYFYKVSKSHINIGQNCRFLSRTTSNLIGINHRCIISTLKEDAQLIIGESCGFSGTTIGCFKYIKLGNFVRCGANTLITDSDWHEDDPRAGDSKSVVIEDNVWLGYGAIVLKGVTIGRNSVIGAGSVVTKDIPANVIAAGNPCRVVRTMDENILNQF